MELTSELLAEVLASLKSNPPRGAESRKRPRVGMSGQVEIIILEQSATPQTARVRDVSEGGIGLLTRQPLQKGSEFMLSLHAKDGENKLIRCMARHCRKV